MFALILFDDGQYYACSTKRIKTDLKTGTTSIKWDDRQYYPGKVIVTHSKLLIFHVINFLLIFILLILKRSLN